MSQKYESQFSVENNVKFSVVVCKTLQLSTTIAWQTAVFCYWLKWAVCRSVIKDWCDSCDYC